MSETLPAHSARTTIPAPEPSGFKSVAHLFLWRVGETPDRDAFSYPDADENWQTMKWREVGERVKAIAAGLRALGLEDEQRVAILSNTRVEWLLADLGVLCAAGATTTIYPSNTPSECTFILTDSNSRFVFVEDASQVNKLVEERRNLPNVAKVITFNDGAGHDGWVISLAKLERRGRDHHQEDPEQYEATIHRIQPSWLATVIYTSGTTGRPKGVELLHDCWVYETEAIDALGILTEDDKQYLWLPLSHSFGKMLEVVMLKIGFPTCVDGRIPRLVDNLSVVRPTFMAAAPRIFEKVYNTVVTTAKSGGGLRYRIFRWALAVGSEVSRLRQQDKEPRGLLALKYAIAHRLVFSKLQQRFGGRLRFFISGSAPLSQEMAEFFHAAGILILEGYGLTESSAASFINLPHNFKFGTVGLPLPGTEAIMAEADGEILLRGRGIMRGYRDLPDVNAETLEGGWLLTGDIGEIDQDGFLRITDRKKDLIKTSGGKYVAPQHLESKLKAACPYLSQVLVHGNKRNYCTALLTLDEQSISKWAKDNGLEDMGHGELVRNEKVRAMVQESVDEMNSGLARYETIKKFALLEEDFTVETGELTASLKVKRKLVERKYADLLDGFYTSAMADV
ncbi:MAG: long-chain fatty acid--CoA ligase [Deltaproteobacteria bacterium]|nr:long-chain fatty acid--CoA ligase [Deltaproteobacteria bacterium]